MLKNEMRFGHYVEQWDLYERISKNAKQKHTNRESEIIIQYSK